MAELHKVFTPLPKYRFCPTFSVTFKGFMAAFIGIFTSVLLLFALVYLFIKYQEALKAKNLAEQSFNQWQEYGVKADAELQRLSKYEGVANIDEQVRALTGLASTIDEENKRKTAGVDAVIAEREEYALALKRYIEGYSTEFVIPEITVLDELEDDYGYTDAARNLKEVRGDGRKLIRTGGAALAHTPLNEQKEAAQRFILEAFNGKVEEALADIKNENFGILSKQIKDCFRIINEDGMKLGVWISEPYLKNRLEELRIGMILHQIRLKDKEEQQRLRELEREEALARREEEKRRKEQEKKEQELEQRRIEKEAELERAKRAWEMSSEVEKQKMQEHYESMARELEKTRKAFDDFKKEQESQPTIAQLQSSGHIYIISNYGSFGEDVVKVGMTRRSVEDRVYELGDASVPFEFDIEGTLYHPTNALELEAQLHDLLLERKLNRVNPRKEFFKITITELKQFLQSEGFDVKWTIASDVQEWREKRRNKRQWELNQELIKQHEADPNLYNLWLEKRRKSRSSQRRSNSVYANGKNGEDT